MGKLSSAKMACIVFVFCVATAIAASAQTYTDLYNYGGVANDPNDPVYSGVIAQGRDGNMYSTSPQTWSGQSGDVFEITPAGAVTVLHNFNGTDGSFVIGGLTLGLDGNFYGTAGFGGAHGYGNVFKITPSGNLTILYSFTNGLDGGVPHAPPIEGLDGNFYGTAWGTNGNNGSVYKISPAGVFTILHSFGGADGANPVGPLTEAVDGNFYGTTENGGVHGLGTVFRITPRGQLTVLHSFDGTDGQMPLAALIQGSDGNFYGITFAGGSSGVGAIFKIASTGHYTVLHNFTGSDGKNPAGGLLQATDGNIYGINGNGPILFTGGVIFSITPGGTFTTLYEFNGSQGGSAQSPLLQHTNGILYSETAVGGSFNRGVFYSLDVGLSPFVTFLPAARPVAGVVQILGQGFTGATAVSFNGTAAPFTVESDTFLTATVPAGATTGTIAVTTPGGVLQSNKIFRVTPQIFSFSPTKGRAGKTVVITGESFTGANEVILGPLQTRMSFTVNSDTQITAIVPAGAESGPIGVHTPGGHALSPMIFTVKR